MSEVDAEVFDPEPPERVRRDVQGKEVALAEPDVLLGPQKEKHDTQVALPENEELRPPVEDTRAGYRVYHFPEKCKVHHPPVDRRKLSLVIALAVASICLWGTLIGSMLPLVFRRLGVDPGVASSPFVATFVDVTGIVIYFSIARLVFGSIIG